MVTPLMSEVFFRGSSPLSLLSVLYTHLTLPTNREVYNSVVAVSLQKKTRCLDDYLMLSLNN